MRGGASNRGFLCELLDHPDVSSNAVDVEWLDREWPSRQRRAQPYAWLAVAAAAVEAFKRLKPAPKRAEQPRFVHASQRTKADRRWDGQRRQDRNERQRHPHRADGHQAHRSSAQDRNGQPRDSQKRDDRPRSNYRPETYREPGERQPQPADDRGGQRSNGAGQPMRPFRGRRRPGGQRRAG